MRTLAVLRPEPGNTTTCARIVAAGGTPLALPLFEIRPLTWEPPPAGRFDALFLTSANAVRQAGAALTFYRGLPVFAVGEATAVAARAAGLAVAHVGSGDARELAARAGEAGVKAALHLAGRDRAHDHLTGVAETIAVYASEPVALSPTALTQLANTVALLHSPRAAMRLAELAPDHAAIRIAAISPAVLAAAGSGWAASTVASHPDDAALIAAGLTLAD